MPRNRLLRRPNKRMASHIVFEQWVPAPVERVFLFFADPQNLPRIMPPATGTRLAELKLIPPAGRVADQPLAGVGSEIFTSFRLFPFLPFRATWIALITEFEWNHHFADIQKRGPFKTFHHRHEFRAETREGVSGTTVRDAITCDAGFGALGALAEKIFVLPQLRSTFAYRQNALVNLLGAESTR